MINFIEYIVSEIKSKRLSKENALSIIRQYTQHASGAIKTSVIHPLVHNNTSDINQLSYSTTFSGDEFFLNDHKIKTNTQNEQKILPGVVYLEMSRAAVENAMPYAKESGIIELRNIVWAKPIVVTSQIDVHIALFATDEEIQNNQINFEIYSMEKDENDNLIETIHCQGQAVVKCKSEIAKIDVVQLKTQMNKNRLNSKDIYPAYKKIGINFGPAHQGLAFVYQGNLQSLAHINLPASVKDTQYEYLLHPSIMDSALQASLGLIDNINNLPNRPSLPFAMDSLTVISSCEEEMFAWLRYSPGSNPNSSITKLDIDLIDNEGNVCAQIKGFSSRIVSTEISNIEVQNKNIGTLYATPTWKNSNNFEQNKADYSEHHIILVDYPHLKSKKLEINNIQCQIHNIDINQSEHVSDVYNKVALETFEIVQKTLKRKPQGKVIFQTIIGHKEGQIFAGLSGLFKSASLENPKIIGQIILVNSQIMDDELLVLLKENHCQTKDNIIKYEQNTRFVLNIEEIQEVDSNPEIVFKDLGVYLITGGLGGLGTIFTKEIIKQTNSAKVILTGRSELTDDKKVTIENLNAQGMIVEYHKLDLNNPKEVKQLINEIINKHKQLNGIIHCAGMIIDNFIIKKSQEDFNKVLAPKVIGTQNLDDACKEIELDFMVLFSSGASLTGNNGQSDYAAANGFLDQFAVYRNQLVAAKKRKGITLSINWPLWQDGGMSLDIATQELMQQNTGMHPMSTDTGLGAFYKCLKMKRDQVLVVEGELLKLRDVLFNKENNIETEITEKEEISNTDSISAENLELKTEEYIKKQLSALLKYPSNKIDSQAPLEKYGIDSILAMDLTNQLEKTFGSLSKTLFFEYQTIHELSEYFIKTHSNKLNVLFSPSKKDEDKKAKVISTQPKVEKNNKDNNKTVRTLNRQRQINTSQINNANPHNSEPIAIIGLSGCYPEARDINAFWRNLRDGKDCIIEVPRNRWDWREYFTEDRSKRGCHFSKWGGFIDGVDEFDPRFFNISPAEAETIDPQERLFLQHAYMAIEDAGYTRASLQIPHENDIAAQVGVYVGVMYSEYQLFGAQASALGYPIGIGGSYASVANRVSYFLNLHGPSLTLDTMCSSSLTAIHIACQDLKKGTTDLAIAGGVNVSIHPNKYLVISEGQFISSGGHCQSFGEGGDGYIPGEGVGAVILKRLSEAQKDGNHIYGIIKGSALNHGGKTNGYTVPNPQAQCTVISRALRESNVNSRYVSYIEAHGTGTKLGDPIEIAALSQAFNQHTNETGFCLIGSAKSNIGHCESAAGIAGLTKVLLQMKYKQIVPSLHSKSLNPHIDFEKTPFIVNQTLRTWERPVINGQEVPRIAGISSFGAGGSNAHIVVQEHISSQDSKRTISVDSGSNVVIPLSARTKDQLKKKARDLLAFISQSDVAEEQHRPLDLVSIAYTLQVGREAMDERLGFMVNSICQLSEKLNAFLNDEHDIEDFCQGTTEHSQDTFALFRIDSDLKQTIDKWIEAKKFSKLLELWVMGLDFDWDKLYGEIKPPRMSLPTYPFAKEHYWIDKKLSVSSSITGMTTQVLHPLLHVNTSDLLQQSYTTTFNGDEFFLKDHQVKIEGNSTQKILPAVAYLEMARAAIEKAVPTIESSMLEINNIAWAQPIVVSESKQTSITLQASGIDLIDFEISSQVRGEDVHHCNGQASIRKKEIPLKNTLEMLKAQMIKRQIDMEEFYETFTKMGIIYGPAHQGVVSILQGENQLLATLRLPKKVDSSQHRYYLHPSILDSALQTSIGLIGDLRTISKPVLPFALKCLRVISPSTEEMFAWVRYSTNNLPDNNVTKIDIDIFDKDGNICIQMEELTSREINNVSGVSNEKIETLLSVPVWKPDQITVLSENNLAKYNKHHIILCNMSEVKSTEIEASINNCSCLNVNVQQKNIAECYSEVARVVFEHLQSILIKPEGTILVQLVIVDSLDQTIFTGLSGLLKTASLENPQLIAQTLLIDERISVKDLVGILQENKSRSNSTLIKYEHGKRYLSSWQEVDTEPNPSKVIFKDDGVYLITGGLGGLGILFAREILEKTNGARIVLTGRSELTKDKKKNLDELLSINKHIIYKQTDITNFDQVNKLVAEIKNEYKQINGIIHSAGIIQDNFILKKTCSEFDQVLLPKVRGTFNLDEASKDIELDFLVLFSSVTSTMGNVGQADYAAANGFMDQFATYRNKLIDKNLRFGQTLSINWPLWKDGGMSIDQETRNFLSDATGMQLMQTSSGLFAFYKSLELKVSQTMVIEGDFVKIRRLLDGRSDNEESHQIKTSLVSEKHLETDLNNLENKVNEYLRKEFSSLLKLPVDEIDQKAPLEKYGIDSIIAMKLTSKLEETFGSLSKTLFFEYQTVAGLTKYFVKSFPEIVLEKIGLKQQSINNNDNVSISPVKKTSDFSIQSKRRFLGTNSKVQNDIAIIGISGKYPMASTLEEFWENLKNSRDCITEIPSERWDCNRYFDPDRNKIGRSYTKWGGFISDVDKFDPLFFNISPKEAELIDPQERLFLETVWQTIEDAGYSKEGISTGKVGVYVGVMYGHYELYGVQAMAAGNVHIPSSSFASIANRISYFFNLNGPSMALDTMCSSSLTAIHLACEEIRRGEIDSAIAGGVNVSIHQLKYLSLSQGNFASTDGRCRSFGKGGDGYVPGEGVGAVLLKSLDKAIQDGDQIYAVIKSSVVNHGGKTNGYTVPNPNAQAELILNALKKANLDPKTLSYIETHGTGTSLGDPIEITGLVKAFESYTQEKQFCAIGSVKSNIGHLESAAGIAAVTKAVLQLKHKELVPSLHSDELNPFIDFEKTPFYVQRHLAPWDCLNALPRRLGISAFGAGGANAHLILEEYTETDIPNNNGTSGMQELFVLSAKDIDSLRKYAENLKLHLDRNPDMFLTNVAYTLQVGRTPMNERLAIIASSIEELKKKLILWISLVDNNNLEQEDVFQGNIKKSKNDLGSLIEGEAGEIFLSAIYKNNDLKKTARLWISGVDVNWSLLYKNDKPRRVSLPTYPLARERYWINLPKENTPVLPKMIKEIKPEGIISEHLQRLYYYPAWKENDIVQNVKNSIENRCILILDSAGLYIKNKNTLEQRLQGNLLTWVNFETSYKEIDLDLFAVNPEVEDHFRCLIEKLDSTGRLPDYILHYVSEQDMNKEIQNSYTFLFLCQNLMKLKLNKTISIISVITSTNDTIRPINAALGGFFKTLSLENPNFKAKLVEIVNVKEKFEKNISKNIGIVLNEVNNDSWNQQEIRYVYQNENNSHKRFVKQLTKCDLSKIDKKRLPFKQNGVYIISGGLGGLGLIISEYLVKNYQSKLVLFGRSELNDELRDKLSRLKSVNSEVVYFKADVTKLDDMKMLVRKAKEQFSEINGVIHSAGIIKDSFIFKKTKNEMDAVLNGKIHGTINLDMATNEENLDLFIMFSSTAGLMGNPGQCDYAYGNHFLDSFAESRDILRVDNKRSGKTISINWPYWENGGMHISQSVIATIKQQTGICPIPTNEGIQYFEDFLNCDIVQAVPLYGIKSIIENYVSQELKNDTTPLHPISVMNAENFIQATQDYLKNIISEEIKLEPERIDVNERFDSFGIDSMMINRINLHFENDIGKLSKTLLYEHDTIEKLAAHLISVAQKQLIRYFESEKLTFEPRNGDSEVTEYRNQCETDLEIHHYQDIQIKNQQQTHTHVDENIAIIGIHGRFPQSNNFSEYWENLKNGKDLIELIPKDRWDFSEFYHPNPEKAAEGKIYCKWGSFLNDIDKFDPHFFNIPPEEARYIDPQEKLVLESVWSAIEDAGYTRERLKKLHPKAKSADVGVFIGVTTNSYHLLANDEWRKGNMISTSAYPWSIANRVSYFFDFQGPSMPVDTACSSSLVAIHLACESIRKKECQIALAGGVNLYLHPSKYLSFCQKRMISQNGQCRSFGMGDGFVPGEAVGTLILKPLRMAIQDRDHIYAVISASAFNHSGRSNGYSAPNPNSQAELISQTLQNASINPETIQYIEGHGTGTLLGDSLEVTALTQAFQKYTHQKQFCSIGSVKANIGHSESAAGIAGIVKILLQMKHRQLVPTIHCDEENPNIDFKSTPFYLQHKLSDWELPNNQPRRAMITSFGAGGVNACVVVDEHMVVSDEKGYDQSREPNLFLLSAKNRNRLHDYASLIGAFLRGEENIKLADLSYTLQVGREVMHERLAIVAESIEDLIVKLDAWCSNKLVNGLYFGTVGQNGRAKKNSKNKKESITTMLETRNLDGLAEIWIEGEEVDWEKLYNEYKPVRISLPSYPFAKERYWLSDENNSPQRFNSDINNNRLHPLISYNTSTVKEVSFSSLLSDNDFYAKDHQVNNQKVFPGAGFLEMAYIAGNIAGENKISKIKDVVWVQPLQFEQTSRIVHTYLKPKGNCIEYIIASMNHDNDKVVHAEGKLVTQGCEKHTLENEQCIQVNKLKEKCVNYQDGSYYYNLFKKFGFNYGNSFRTIQEFHSNGSFAISKLKLADSLRNEFDNFILHPSIMDGALQSVIGLVNDTDSATPYLPFALDEVEILRPLIHTCYAYVEFANEENRNKSDIKKFNIKLLNETGDILVNMKNFYVRALNGAFTSQFDNVNYNN